MTIRLEPLDNADTESLIGTDVPAELRARIAAAAAGNPLFISEMLAMTQQAGDEVEVPASLKALLAARLDQLDPAERRVLECGSVEGEVFHRSAVQALTPEEAQVTPRLAALVRRELIRSDRPQFAGEDGFRFRHLLIRDTAYDALPKTTRAELHQRFAAWLEQHGELVELDEIVGYHLEQAARFLAELGQDSQPLALAAGERLGAAGDRAFWRGDSRTTVGLLDRALALTRPYRLDVPMEAELADALSWIDMGRSIAVATAAAERATAARNEADTAFARTVAAIARFRNGQCSTDELERIAQEALPLLEAAEDDEAWFTSGTHLPGSPTCADSSRNGRKRRKPRSSTPGEAALPTGARSRSPSRCRSHSGHGPRARRSRPSTLSSPISRTARLSAFERYSSRCSTGSTRPGRSPFQRRNGFVSSATRAAANGLPRSP